jgi:hypothetical protein
MTFSKIGNAFVRRQTTVDRNKHDPKFKIANTMPAQLYYTGKYELVDAKDYPSAFRETQRVISVHDTFEEAKLFADMINKQRHLEGT